MGTVIGCDACELPALEVEVTEAGEFLCLACALAFSLAASVVTDEELEAEAEALAFEEKCEAAMSLACAA